MGSSQHKHRNGQRKKSKGDKSNECRPTHECWRLWNIEGIQSRGLPADNVGEQGPRTRQAAIVHFAHQVVWCKEHNFCLWRGTRNDRRKKRRAYVPHKCKANCETEEGADLHGEIRGSGQAGQGVGEATRQQNSHNARDHQPANGKHVRRQTAQDDEQRIRHVRCEKKQPCKKDK